MAHGWQVGLKVLHVVAMTICGTPFPCTEADCCETMRWFMGNEFAPAAYTLAAPQQLSTQNPLNFRFPYRV